MIWPSGLAVFYPFDAAALSAWRVAGATLLLAAVTWLVLWRGGRRPYLAVGWLWYLGTLVPVIGFVKLGQHAMADRYTYLPLIGLFLIVAWGSAELATKWQVRKGAIALAAGVLFATLSVATWVQTRYWRDSITLFQHAIAVTDNNWLAHKNLAVALAARGDYREALLHASESLRIKPDPDQYVSQGWLYAQLGDFRKSIESCRAALAMAPDNDKARFILGMDHLLLGDHPAALAEYALLSRAGSRYAPELLENLRGAGIDPLAGNPGRGRQDIP